MSRIKSVARVSIYFKQVNHNNKIFFVLLFSLVISLPITFAAELALIYDGNGNLITGDGKYREYNEFNQLIRVHEGNSSSGEVLEEYIYHPTQDRILIKKVDNNGGTFDPDEVTLYFSDNFVRQYSNIGGTPRVNDTYYARDDGGIVGEVVWTYKMHNDTSSDPENITQLGKLYYHNDHLGSTSVITNQSGSVVEQTFYEPFGGIISGGNLSRYDYEGREFSSLTGDYDFRFRKYDPELKIFTQPDAGVNDVYDPQELNRYTFERNNPYKYTDPNGKIPVETVLIDIPALGLDIDALREDNTDFWNYAALVVDVALTVLPYAPAVAGFGIRGVKYASKANDAKAINQMLKGSGVTEEFFEFEGKRIYKNKNLDMSSKESIQNTLSGKSPLTSGGEPFELHHLESGVESSDLAILPRSEHKQITSFLDQTIKQRTQNTFTFAGKEYRLTPNRPSTINRNKFASFRNRFWRKSSKK